MFRLHDYVNVYGRILKPLAGVGVGVVYERRAPAAAVSVHGGAARGCQPVSDVLLRGAIYIDHCSAAMSGAEQRL